MMKKWDKKMVAARLEEAAETMKRLPVTGLQPASYISSWPPVLQEFWEAYGYDKARVRLGPPTGDAISRMDDTLDWLRWLEPEQVRLAWSRAERIPWKLLMRQLGVSRETARQRYQVALVSIAVRLNHINGEKMPRHLSIRHSCQDLP